MSCVEETFIDAIELATDSMASQKSPLNGIVDISLSRMLESVQSDSCLETRLSNLADLTMLTNSVFRMMMNQKQFIAPVTWFVVNTAHDHIQVANVQVRLQKPFRAPHEDQDLEPVEIMSPAERSPSASSSGERKKLRRKRICGRSSKSKSKK